MTKRLYNFGHAYELHRHQLDRKAWRKYTEQQRRRLRKLTRQIIVKKLDITNLKTKLKTLGIY